jgi:spore maturation protein CgeB
MSQEEREMMGQKGHDYVVENHNYTVLAQKFLDALCSVPQKD